MEAGGLVEPCSSQFDAMGFSQGGLFLRYYAQYCNAPPIRTLITFGTPHYGISALIPCPTPPTVSCLLAARAARSGIYSSWAQTHLVQAAYFRDPARLDEFAEINSFVRDLNAEGKYLAGGRTEREEGGMGLRGLERFIAVMFDADRECILNFGCPGPPLSAQPPNGVLPSSPTRWRQSRKRPLTSGTVSPAQSAHFWTYSPENKTELIPLSEQRLYTEDWIGLRHLHETGALVLDHCPGEHMDLGTGDCAKRIVEKWVGSK